MSAGRLAAALSFLLLAISGCSGETPRNDLATGQCPNDLPQSCPATVPSYQAEIMPLLKRACTECHSATGIVPNRPLDNYNSVYSQRQAVLTQVYACRMPPPGAPPLSTADRQLLLTWLICQSPNN